MLGLRSVTACISQGTSQHIRQRASNGLRKKKSDLLKDCQDNTLNLKDRTRNQTMRSQKLGQGHGNQECKWLLRCHRVCLPLPAFHFCPHPLPLLLCSFSVFRAPCSFRSDIGNDFPEGKGKTKSLLQCPLHFPGG